MQTAKVTIKNDGTGLEEALDRTTAFAESLNLPQKERIRLRLLGEELFGVVCAVTKEFSAEYWAEIDGDTAKLTLEAKTSMDPEKKMNLVDISSKGRNEANKGLMGRIFDIFEYIMFTPVDVSAFDMAQMQAGNVQMGCYAGAVTSSYIWSLDQYRNDVRNAHENNEAKEEWDELEKSIIANIADDVKVWIEGDKVCLVIEKEVHAG